MAIKALFLDFGNVFTVFNPEIFFHALKRHSPCTTRELARIHGDPKSVDGLHYNFERGHMSRKEYITTFIERAWMKGAIDEETFEQHFTSMLYRENPNIESVLSKVRTDIDVYLLSNTNEIHDQRYIQKHPVIRAFIPPEKRILSYHYRLAKPEKKFFEMALGYAGVAAHGAILVDDMAENIAAWRKLGGMGIVYHADHAAKSGLEFLLRRNGLFADPKPKQSAHQK